MGLGATLISFTPGEDIRAADMNANFSAINNISYLNVGSVTNATNAAELQTSGGSPCLTVDDNGVCTFPAPPPLDSSGNHFQTWSQCIGFNSGTFNHGYTGTPNYIFPMVNSTNNAEGLGVDTKGSTTFHLTMPTAFSWWARSSNAI
jgi:hypothetical protein